MTEKNESLWSAKEVAHYLGCSIRHLRRLRKRGLPFSKIGGMLRFPKDDVIRWARTTATEPQPPKTFAPPAD